METVTLEAQKRDMNQPAKLLRQQRLIPAVYYGQGEQSVPIQIDYQTFRRTFMKTGSSQLIDLTVDGQKPQKVLVHDLQMNPLTDVIEHIDFLLVNLKEKITAHVPVKLEGEAPAIKDLAGILNNVKSELTVKCLPLELPHDIVVDISGLAEFHSAVHVKDVKVPEGVELLDNPEDVVVIVNPPRVEEEPEVPAEGEEGAEGEEKAEGGEKLAEAEGKEEGAKGEE